MSKVWTVQAETALVKRRTAWQDTQKCCPTTQRAAVWHREHDLPRWISGLLRPYNHREFIWCAARPHIAGFGFRVRV